MVVIIGEKGINVLDLTVEQYNSLFLSCGDQIRFAESLLELPDDQLSQNISLTEGTGIKQAREAIQNQVDNLKEFVETADKANKEHAASKQN